MELEGKIIMDLPMEQGVSKAGNPWKKKGWVLETLGQYPRQVKFDVFGERTNSITFELNKIYVVSVDAQSREFNGRWYTDLTAFNCREVTDMPVSQMNPPQTFSAGAQTGGYTQPGTPIDLPAADPSEDLPF